MTVSDKGIVLTGDRPTGCLHLGHYIGSLKKRIELQNAYNQYIMIADMQALTDHFENPKKISQSIIEVLSDYIAVGIDPAKSTIFLQSKIPALAELMMYYMNLVPISRLERNPTVKTEIAQKNFLDSIPTGFICYPISQAADITAFKAELIPAGEDQVPMIEQTNEIVRKFNRIYNTNVLKETRIMFGKTSRLVGIDGKSKAGKSLGNAIFLSDSPDEIKRKVFSMYTDPSHIKISDPGNVEGNVVFAYLDAFFEDQEEVENLKNRYRKGGYGDTTLKSLLNEVLQKLLKPIREKRSSLNQKELIDICVEGSKKAKRIADATLYEVKSAIGIDF